MLAGRFAKVRANPASAAARREAAKILAALERTDRPTDDEVALIVDDAFVWVGLGFARPARALVDRWLQLGVRAASRSAADARAGRGAGQDARGSGTAARSRRGAEATRSGRSGASVGLGTDRRLRRAAAIYTVAIAPPAAAGKLRAIADDPIAAAASVANHVFRGELRAAIEACKAHDWFLDDPQAISGVAYGVWAQAMLDDFDGALAVLATWRHRHPVLAPAHEHALLAAEARAESIRHHHVRERALLEEALAICDDAGLGLERTYLEASYAIALVRAGELGAAKRIVNQWKVSGAAGATTGEQTLEVYRDVARTELALLGGDLREADGAARRVLAYAEASGNVIYGCLARFHRALAASRSTRPGLLDDYGRTAAQLQIPLHLRRYRLLDELPHNGKLVIRTRRRKRVEPLVRLFYPSLTDLGSDLCWDRVQGTLYLGGDGPFSLADHPIVRRVLEVVLATPSFELAIAALFERVWDMSYEPLRHEGKCHVALHRLRALLGGWRSGADRLVQVRDGMVRIADDASVCVIELPGTARTPDKRADDALTERVVAHLAATGEAAPAALAKRIGTSRNALLQALRVLAEQGRVERSGRGRAIRYRASKQQSAS